MAFWSALIILTLIGCITAVVLVYLDKFGSNRLRMLEEELRRAQDRISQLTFHNENLQKQLEWQSRFLELEDQHGVAKAEEPVPLRDGHLVGTPDQLAAGERAHEHQQR